MFVVNFIHSALWKGNFFIFLKSTVWNITFYAMFLRTILYGM